MGNVQVKNTALKTLEKLSSLLRLSLLSFTLMMKMIRLSQQYTRKTFWTIYLGSAIPLLQNQKKLEHWKFW